MLIFYFSWNKQRTVDYTLHVNYTAYSFKATGIEVNRYTTWPDKLANIKLEISRWRTFGKRQKQNYVTLLLYFFCIYYLYILFFSKLKVLYMSNFLVHGLYGMISIELSIIEVQCTIFSAFLFFAGTRFDIRNFHSLILTNGVVPTFVLEILINDLIEEVKAKPILFWSSFVNGNYIWQIFSLTSIFLYILLKGQIFLPGCESQMRVGQNF